MEHGLKDIVFYVQKHITPCTVVITSLLVHDKPLEAPASVKLSIVLQRGCHGSLVSLPWRDPRTKVPRNHCPETPSGRTQIPMTSTHNQTCWTRQLDHNSAQRLPERWNTHLRNNQYVCVNTLWPRIQYRKWQDPTSRPTWNMMMGTAWGWETLSLALLI